jgi:hypothetical protein
MKKHTLILCAMLLLNAAQAQNLKILKQKTTCVGPIGTTTAPVMPIYDNIKSIENHGYIATGGQIGGVINFNFDAGQTMIRSAPSYCHFIAKLDSNLTPYKATIALQQAPIGTGSGLMSSLSFIDRNKNVYLTGEFFGKLIIAPSAEQIMVQSTYPFGTNADNFIIKFDSAAHYQWHKILKPTNDSTAMVGIDITHVNKIGQMYLSGYYEDGFTMDSTVQAIHLGNYPKTFRLTLDSTGNLANYNELPDQPSAFYPTYRYKVLDNGQYYISTIFGGTVDLDFGTGVDLATANGFAACAISKYDSLDNYLKSVIITGSTPNGISNFFLLNEKEIVFSGNFRDTLDIDFTTNGVYNLVGMNHTMSQPNSAFLAVTDLDFNLKYGYLINDSSGIVNPFDYNENYFSETYKEQAYFFNTHSGLTKHIKLDSIGNIIVNRNQSMYTVGRQMQGGEIIVSNENNWFTGAVDMDCFGIGTSLVAAPTPYKRYLAMYDNTTNFTDTVVIGTTAPTPAPHTNVKVYPNPVRSNARGNINVQFGEGWAGSATIAIYDAMGKKVRQQTTQATTTAINISGLAAGIYTLKVSGNNANTTQKLVVY